MNTTLEFILRHRHNFTVAGGIVLSAFTNIATQVKSYQWACPWNIVGFLGLALFVPAGWALLNLAGYLTTWYQWHGPMESNVVIAITKAEEGKKFVGLFVCASASFVTAIALWVLFLIHQPAGR